MDLRRVLRLGIVTTFFAACVANAQIPAPPSPLQFPQQTRGLSFFSPLQMDIYKPEGTGPFPALVLVHTCSGLRQGSQKPAQEVRVWTRRALDNGYAVFVIDHFSQRGIQSECTPPSPPRRLPFLDAVKDVHEALAHLSKFPEIDVERVGLIGFSWGAMVGLLASSPESVSKAFGPGRRYRAVTAFYPRCFLKGIPGQRNDFTWLVEDVDRPLLVLMGGLDNETPPEECLPRLASLKARNAPVAWHLYPDATHCWNCETLDGQRKQVGTASVVYTYSKTTTEDSIRRALEFLDRQVKNAK